MAPTHGTRRAAAPPYLAKSDSTMDYKTRSASHEVPDAPLARYRLRWPERLCALVKDLGNIRERQLTMIRGGVFCG
jgi:hypothetical protein